MPFRTKVKKKTLYLTKEKREVYVITADRGGGINADKIAAFVSRETGAREAQVKMILNSIVGSIITWLEEGHAVRVGDLGSFVPSVTCKSSDDPSKVEIKQKKLNFYPSKLLAEKIRGFNLTTENPYTFSTEQENH